jgi:DNA topoisomerase IB
LQALGTDAAGRRQYIYHRQWREHRDREKHERILTVARRLPQARARVAADLALGDMSRNHVLAAAFRLLDLGLFRVGGEAYLTDNGSYGLATLRRDHVRVTSDGVVFDYRAKSGQQRRLTLIDEDCASVIATLKRRGDAEHELLAWRRIVDGKAVWRDITSEDINAYVREVVGIDTTTKDFRTWHATVLAARALAEASPAEDLSLTARKRTVAAMAREVAEQLGNTPAVARASYIDPRVVDLWEDEVTIRPIVEALGREGEGDLAPGQRSEVARETLERATVDLLTLAPEKVERRLQREAALVARRQAKAPAGRSIAARM